MDVIFVRFVEDIWYKDECFIIYKFGYNLYIVMKFFFFE